MAANSKFQIDTLRPLTGPLDCRSSPDNLPSGSFRWLLNMWVNLDGKRARRAGWQKLNYGDSFVNQDLHDQRDCWEALTALTFAPEPVTLLYEATSTDQERRLYAATRSRVYLQSGSAWKIIGRGFGAVSASSRFYVSQLANTLIFTNGVDRPKMHTFGSSSDPCSGTDSMFDIPELINAPPGFPLSAIGLSRAKLTRSYNGCIFLFDTVENGVRYPSRIRWSGFNQPTKWWAGADTVAGFQDLPYDENIAGVAEIASNLIVFTDRSIYKSTFDGTTFTFTRLYNDPRAQSKLLAYPNTLVSDGNSLWWFSYDGIWTFNLYLEQPVRPDWLHVSTKVLFDALDTTCCEPPVGEFNPQTKEIWWSYPEAGQDCSNNRTLVANLKYNTSDYVDYGFSTFSNFRPDTRQSLASWLAEYCAPGGDANSLCAVLGARVVDDFCDECTQLRLFLGASLEDTCLKMIGTAYIRERCTNYGVEGTFDPDGVYEFNVGTYASDGYFSILRGSFPFGHMEASKVVKHFLLDTKVLPAVGPASYLRLRIGTAYQALDPNPSGAPDAFGYAGDASVPADHCVPGDICEVVWRKAGNRLLLCPETRTNTSSLLANTRPDKATEWPVVGEGRFLYYELTVVGSSPVAPIGGAAAFNRIEVTARLKPVAS